MNILVTDGNTRPALAIVRSLGSKGNKLFVGETTEPSLASSSRYCFEGFMYPDPFKDTDRFLDSLIQVIQEYAIDIVLPVTDVTTLSVTANKKEIERFCSVPFADSETTDFLSNKFKVLQFAQKLNIPIPKTIFILDKIQINSLSKDLTFPVVIKPARSRVYSDNKWISTDVSYADNLEELKNVLKNRSETDFPLMLQERIVGPGIGIFVCYKRGKCIAHFCHRRLREKPPTGGVSVLSESIPVVPLAKEYTEKLLNRLNWHGVAMGEFKLDEQDNIPKLMEVNSRFWGSLQLAISSGIDFPSILVNMSENKGDNKIFDYKTSVRNRWFWGDFDRLCMLLLKNKNELNLPPGHKGRIMSILDFFKISGKGLHYEVLSFNDIKPWFYETLQWFKKKDSKAIYDKTEGLFHVHSNYSNDGKSSVTELVRFCEDKGYGFILMTEHSDDFNELKMRSYVEECKRSSNERVLVIPGLEFSFSEYPNLHLLGVGINEYIDSQNITAVVEGIRRQGGLAIIAHPSRNNHFVPAEIIDKIDGLEMWNAAYDSRYLPRYKSARLYKNLRKKNNSLIALGGLDMHMINNFKDLTITVYSKYTNSKDLITALKKGQFNTKGKIIKLKSKLKIGCLSQCVLFMGHILLDIADYIYWAIFRLKKVFQN